MPTADARMRLVCCGCGRVYAPFRLACDDCGTALLRTEYAAEQLVVADCASLFKFADWLPCTAPVRSGAGPVMMSADRLAKAMGLKALVIAFNGYWPER